MGTLGITIPPFPDGTPDEAIVDRLFGVPDYAHQDDPDEQVPFPSPPDNTAATEQEPTEQS